MPTLILLGLTVLWPQWAGGLVLIAYGVGLLALAVAPGLYDSLFSPLHLSGEALSAYAESRVEPELPTDQPDLAGRLMAEVQRVLILTEQSRKSHDIDTATDPLTGMLNRRSATRRIGSDMLRGLRDGRPFCLATMEVENARDLQVKFGNDAMDDVCKVIARRMAEPLRRSDWVAHMGNAEFTIGLWGANPDQASTVMQRVVESVDGQTRVPVILNVGVALSTEGQTPDRLMAMAVTAMARARKSGGNAVEVEQDNHGHAE
jgi:two-component system cell cycle response regulator